MKPEELKETRAYSHDKPHIWHFKEMTCLMSVKLAPLAAVYSLDRERRGDPLIATVPLLNKVLPPVSPPPRPPFCHHRRALVFL